MWKSVRCIAVVPLMFVLCGCLTADETVHRFDFATGMYVVEYHDIRSQKDQRRDVADKDWVLLKEQLQSTADFGPGIVFKSKKLFQDDDVLAGKAVYQVQCVTCYESKVDLLKHLFVAGEWGIVGNEIVLSLAADDLSEANGKLIEQEDYNLYAWPLDAEKFEVTVMGDFEESESLLGKYLEEEGLKVQP